MTAAPVRASAPVPASAMASAAAPDLAHLRDLPAAERDSALAENSATLEGRPAEEIAAIGNLDPYSRANVLSGGIVGSRGEAVFVASPSHKQPFNLRTGQCLDDPGVSAPTFDVRVVDGVVQVLAPPDKET